MGSEKDSDTFFEDLRALSPSLSLHLSGGCREWTRLTDVWCLNLRIASESPNLLAPCLSQYYHVLLSEYAIDGPPAHPRTASKHATYLKSTSCFIVTVAQAPRTRHRPRSTSSC